MSAVKKRSVSIRGHRTSFSLEDAFADVIGDMAKRRGISFAALVAFIDETRPRDTNLSSALRLAALNSVRDSSSHHGEF